MTAEAKANESEDLTGEDKGDDDEETKNRKRRERLEQNRVSARESRKRKKTMIEELQRTVITLSRENKDLNDRNETLRRQLMEIGAKYPSIVPLQAIMSGSAAGTTAPTAGAPNAATAPPAASAVTQAPGTATPAPAMVAFPQVPFWQQGQGGASQPGAPAAAPGSQPPAPSPGQSQNV